MKRRGFLVGGIFGFLGSLLPFGLKKSQAKPSKNSEFPVYLGEKIPIVQFSDKFHISNLEEIFQDIPFVGNDHIKRQETVAWLSKENAILEAKVLPKKYYYGAMTLIRYRISDMKNLTSPEIHFTEETQSENLDYRYTPFTLFLDESNWNLKDRNDS